MAESNVHDSSNPLVRIVEETIELDSLECDVVVIKFVVGSLFVWVGQQKTKKPEISDLSLCIGNNAISGSNDDQSFSKYLSIHLSKLNNGKPVYASISEDLGVQMQDRRTEFLRRLIKFLRANSLS